MEFVIDCIGVKSPYTSIDKAIEHALETHPQYTMQDYLTAFDNEEFEDFEGDYLDIIKEKYPDTWDYYKHNDIVGDILWEIGETLSWNIYDAEKKNK